MFRIHQVVQLQPEERVMLLVRRHARSVAWPLFFAALLIIVPFFFLFPLVRAGAFGMALFSLLLAVGVVFAIRVFLIWDSYVLLLTNQRVIHVEQTGVWRSLVREIPLDSLQQMHTERRSILDTVFQTSSLHLKSHGHGSIVFPQMYKADVFIRSIDTVRKPSERDSVSNRLDT